MLDEHGVTYRYREYRDEPLVAEEIRGLLGLLQLKAHELLRPKEAAQAGLDASTPEEEILMAMCEQPTLIQRPILTDGKRAVLARPADLMIPFMTTE